MAIQITYEEALEDLRRAVEEKGEDYVYPRANPDTPEPTCVYFEPDGTPSCIVGHVLAYRGITFDHDSSLNRRPAYSLFDGNLLTSDDGRASELLRETQYQQDIGTPWGDALETAIENVEGGINDAF